MMARALFILCLLLAGCSGGAVVFAPTPLPPDQSLETLRSSERRIFAYFTAFVVSLRTEYDDACDCRVFRPRQRAACAAVRGDQSGARGRFERIRHDHRPLPDADPRRYRALRRAEPRGDGRRKLAHDRLARRNRRRHRADQHLHRARRDVHRLDRSAHRRHDPAAFPPLQAIVNIFHDPPRRPASADRPDDARLRQGRAAWACCTWRRGARPPGSSS